MPTKNKSLVTETLKDPISEEETLLTESIRDNVRSPRKTVVSGKSLDTEGLPPPSEPLSEVDMENAVTEEPILFEQIRKTDSDLSDLLSESELLVLVPCFLIYRKAIQTQYEKKYLHYDPVNRDSMGPKLIPYEQYLYRESDKPSPPVPESQPVRIINRSVLERRKLVMDSLRRPYHPILYTSVSSRSFVPGSGSIQPNKEAYLLASIEKSNHTVGVVSSFYCSRCDIVKLKRKEMLR